MALYQEKPQIKTRFIFFKIIQIDSPIGSLK